MKSNSGAAAARTARELRARFNRARDAAGDAIHAGVARIKEWEWRWILSPPPGLASSSSSALVRLSRSAAASVRGVATGHKLLLLGLLLLQLLVLAVLRSTTGSSSHGRVDHGGRTLYTVPAKNRFRREKVEVVPSQIDHDLAKNKEEAMKASIIDRPRGDVSRSTVLDNAASKVAELEPKDGGDEKEELEQEQEQEQTRVGGEDGSSDEQGGGKMNEFLSQEEQQIGGGGGGGDGGGGGGGGGDDELDNERDEQNQIKDNNSNNNDNDLDRDRDNDEDKDESKETSIIASENAILEEDPVCKGGRIFVYDLPPRFNADLLANCSVLNPWMSLCDALSNGGLGKPMTTTPWPSSTPSPWYYTEQFSGEVIFHSRILRHPCVTNDSDSANVFYVPYYAGLDVSRYLWKPSNAGDRDGLGHKLVEWLSTQPAWTRARGRDHFTMIGRITWDFRRIKDSDWGSGLLNKPEMKNMTRLAIESNPWEGGEYGVPYPTSFHPRDEHQLQDWQEFVKNRERGVLFSFAGATRKRIPNDFRLELLAQCSNSRGACTAMDCSDSKCETPEPVLELFLNSTFCLQPRGDGYTRRSIFDSVLAGCIPVFFWNQSSYWQYKWFFPEEDESYSVFIDREDVRKGTKIVDVLSKFTAEQVKRMRNALVDVLARLVYATPDHELTGADAFDTAIDGVLRSMLRMNLRLQKSSG